MRPAPARWLSRVKGVGFLRFGQAETARHAGDSERGPTASPSLSPRIGKVSEVMTKECLEFQSSYYLPQLSCIFVCKKARANVEQAVWRAWEARCVYARLSRKSWCFFACSFFKSANPRPAASCFSDSSPLSP